MMDFYSNGPIFVKISPNIYLGNSLECKILEQSNSGNWAFLHCTKTYHKKMLGYSRSLDKNNPHYLFFKSKNEAALNLVDMDYKDDLFFEATKVAFEQAFAFLDEQLEKGKKVFIHCNQGTSRGPSVAMLYLARNGKYQYADFETTTEIFKKTYPKYNKNPNKQIYVMIKSFWNHFVKKPQTK